MGMNRPLSTATALTLILPMWRIWWAPNSGKWRMGFKLGKLMGMNQPLSTATALTLILPMWRIWWAPNASKWQMGFNSAFKVLKYA
jgi:hypothetical protein